MTERKPVATAYAVAGVMTKDDSEAFIKWIEEWESTTVRWRAPEVAPVSWDELGDKLAVFCKDKPYEEEAKRVFTGRTK